MFAIRYSYYSVTFRDKFKTFSPSSLINLELHQMLEQCTDNEGSKYILFLAIPKSNFNPSLSRVSLTIRKRLQIAFSVHIYPSLGHICFSFCFVLLCFVLFVLFVLTRYAK